MTPDSLFSSLRQDWRTPRWLFDALHAEFLFDLDAAASAGNALCKRYLTEADNALTVAWRPACAAWCNPPYTRRNGGLGAWLTKARAEAARGVTVVMLIPARVDASWWTRNVPHADEVRFIDGRLRFDDGTENAPFPSAIVIFRPPVTIPGPNGITYIHTPSSLPAYSYLMRQRGDS